MTASILIFIGGLILMICGADFFVKGASSLALRFKIPQIVIGLTIVAMGTSAPEVCVSVSSALKGSTGVAIGNVLGSNIINILLILGLTSVICALKLERNSVKYEIPFLILITAFLCGFGNYFENLDRIFGLILLGLFALFFVYLFKVAKKSVSEEENEVKQMSIIKIILYTIGGIVALVYGSDVSVNCAINIAHQLNISERIIGLTVVAVGTSLPELVTSVVAAIKKQPDIAVGNIVGSNIFNILLVLGVTCSISPVLFDKAFIFDSIVAIVSVILLFAFTVCDRKLNRIEGSSFLILYVAYTLHLIAK